MRRSHAGLVFFLAVSAGLARGATAQPSLEGRWEGAFVRQNSIQSVSVTFTTARGAVHGTYDIPDLGLYDEPLADIRITPPTVEFKLLYGVFPMHLHDDITEMTGENAKWGPPVALHLKKTSEPRSQVKKEEVAFRNGSVTLAGTLYEPQSAGPHTAVVIVHGSGALGRDRWEYRSLGDLFARHGIAALVYDKRGVGRSTGDTDSATFDDLAGDAVAAVELLARRPGIARTRIGLMGSSQGGWVAPLAAHRSHRVSFLILDKGAAVSVEEQERERVEYGMRADGLSDEDIRAALAYMALVFRAAYSGEGRDELRAATERARSAAWAKFVQLAETEKDLEGWRLQRFDPAPVLKRTTVPVLALFGENDTLVPPRENAERMRQYLQEAGNRDVTIRVFPGQGHSRFMGQSLKGGKWEWPDGYWIWDKQSPEFVETVVSWALERGRRAGT